MFNSKILIPALLTLSAQLALAARADLVEMRVEDRDGRAYREYRADGNYFIAGERNEPYQIRLRNLGGQRVLVVLSVDGVNAVSGQTAGFQQAGYVLDPWQSTTVVGWRKSLSSAAQFYFTYPADSYAARTGRPRHLGVIGAAVFQERRYRMNEADELEDAGRARAEMPAPMAKGRPSPQARLGTGHGETEYSRVERTRFERASDSPYETLSIRYDSRRNLVAAGIIRERWRDRDWREPQPFPAEGFVADPPARFRESRDQ